VRAPETEDAARFNAAPDVFAFAPFFFSEAVFADLRFAEAEAETFRPAFFAPTFFRGFARGLRGFFSPASRFSGFVFSASILHSFPMIADMPSDNLTKVCR